MILPASLTSIKSLAINDLRTISRSASIAVKRTSIAIFFGGSRHMACHSAFAKAECPVI
jgi:hypothetical protein